jgi:hypothetical protein
MRSVALIRLSLAAFGTVVLGTASAQLLQMPIAIPTQQLHLAWTLARVLLQL